MKSVRTFVTLVAAVIVGAACHPQGLGEFPYPSEQAWDEMTGALLGPLIDASLDATGLPLLVAREAIPFTARDSVPANVIDRLIMKQVIVVGETVPLREHYAFLLALLQALHESRVRQLLVEQPQMLDWMLDDYVLGGELEPAWSPSLDWLGRFAAIREFNATLPPEERVRVRAIDANGVRYGGARTFRNSLRMLAARLPSAGPLETFLQADYGSPAAQRAAIRSVRIDLAADETALRASWGARRYDAVREMIEVERASIDIRASRGFDDDGASRAREDVIKRLADARIGGYPHRTIVDVGAEHAQKSPLLGPPQEWLGDYLVHRSAAVDGPVVVIAAVAATIEPAPGSPGPPYDVTAASPYNELFRLLAATWPGRTVFLPLEDSSFAADSVLVNFEGTVYRCTIAEHYDAVLQYRVAHRFPGE